MTTQTPVRNILASRASGVAVITALDSDGQPRGLTCSAFCEVSADPPLLLVCVDKRSETLVAIREAGSFVVNILAAGRDEVSNRFATKYSDKFDGLAWEPSSAANGAPILHQDVIAYAECRVFQSFESGDHWIFVGQILDGMADEDLGPLLYFRRRYGAWPQREAEIAHA